VDLSEELVKTGVAVFAGGTGVLIAGMMAIRKSMSQWKELSAVDTKNGALASVYTMLAEEIARMSAQNTQLSASLGELHAEVLALRRENSELRDEVGKLNRQICNLRVVYNTDNAAKIATRRGDATLEVTDGTTA
jgi:regulator of replication initiation timing